MVKKAKGETTHYVFQGTEPIFEKRISAGKAKSYVYALGKYLARVDGVIGDSEAKKYFYHTDHVGSIRVITDQAGKVVYNADYLAFGNQFVKDGDFEELHGFTGKEYDPDIGLYYFNARWYDPDLGRFISEDPAGQGPNPYSYCGNSPVMRVDPTGEFWWVFALLGGLDSYLNGGDFMQGFVMGAITGAMGAGVNTFVSSAWGSTLGAFGSQVVSGAIAGGITGEMFGEGFGKGAVFGAVAGAISYGVDMRFGEYASRGTFNKLIIDGLKGGLNGLVRGGDFVEGFAYGFAYGAAYEYGSNSFESPAPDGVGNAEDDNYQQLTSALEDCDVQITLLEMQLKDMSLTSEQRDQINQKINEWLQFKVRIQNSIPRFLWPATGTITSNYDPNRSGFTTKEGKKVPPGHRAIDIANVIGTPIVAIANGTVSNIYKTEGSGNIIEIDYGNGFTSSFHHLNGYADNIFIGTHVLQGQVVAYMGNTGTMTTGTHLHFTLRLNGVPVNPHDYLPEW